MTEIQCDAPALDRVLHYHKETKHHFHAFARGPGRLDWANQPDPFRRYAHTALIRLGFPSPDSGPDYAEAGFEDVVAAQPLTADTIAQFLYDSFALSAWKQVGTAKWALRVNPSSGNLHPTEAYVVCPPIAGLVDAPSVAHYAPAEHALELRAHLPDEIWRTLAARLPAGSFLLGLSSIPWREAWKYGERAFRYCQHDVGHAIGAAAFAAAALGWQVRLCDDWHDDALCALLGLAPDPGIEDEIPECLLVVSPTIARPVACLAQENQAALARVAWQGVANRLSANHRVWPTIDAVRRATQRPPSISPYPARPRMTGPTPDRSVAGFPLRRIIHQRRSAVAMDGRSGLTRAAFYQILLKAYPGLGQIPASSLPWSPCIHFGLFVHRVAGLDPGLYVLVRDPSREAELRGALNPEFAWQTPPHCPAPLPLYQLILGDARALAARLSCTQDIAGDGAFSVAMLAEFRASLERYGAWFYRRLFWEAGAVGQLLYLEAEASGMRATGIGCYFDDPVHETFGLRDDRFQSLYHFTVGGPVEDLRLVSLPPYPFYGADAT